MTTHLRPRGQYADSEGRALSLGGFPPDPGGRRGSTYQSKRKDTMSKPDASTRPNFGTTTSLRNGVITVTRVNPDGTQTVERVPAGQAQKPAK
jgi:hypothetical protein